jgi:hypothetical protein
LSWCFPGPQRVVNSWLFQGPEACSLKRKMDEKKSQGETAYDLLEIKLALFSRAPVLSYSPVWLFQGPEACSLKRKMDEKKAQGKAAIRIFCWN